MNYKPLIYWQVRAVLRPELSDYVDVIVLPVKGDRSLASLLAGGGAYAVLHHTLWLTDMQMIRLRR